MTSASIAGSLLMQEVSAVGDVTLRGAKIGGHVSMVSSKFAGQTGHGSTHRLAANSSCRKGQHSATLSCEKQK